MSDHASPEQFVALLTEIEVRMQQDREADAAGWVVVVVDNEFDSIVHVVGLFSTPEAALIECGLGALEDKKIMDEGDVGWTRTVVPMFAPTP